MGTQQMSPRAARTSTISGPLGIRMWQRCCQSLLVLMLCFLAACEGDSKAGNTMPDSTTSDPGLTASLDSHLQALTENLGLTGDPASRRGLVQTRPDEDPLVKLGQMLFFSQSLSGSFDVACASCHLPDLGGSDALSLSVGVVPVDRRVVGPMRQIDPARDRDPQADAGPNMHRNSITTFNAALYDRVMMFDGRIRVAGDNLAAGGKGLSIITPETAPNHDVSGVEGLLAVTSKFPVTNNNEMRGFYYADISNHDDFRRRLMERLKGTADWQFMSPGSGENWLALFRAGFQDDVSSADQLITLENTQRALGRFVESQIFVDTPWRSYLQGDASAISEPAKRGAVLFFETSANGGLGCSECHSGDRFTNEQFYNVGMPQIGRGFQGVDGADFGRWQHTRADEDMYAFRVPGLLNVDLTAPYGHAGTFASLESLLTYHVNPRAELESFDFSLQRLPQFVSSGINYPNARTHSYAAQAQANFDSSETLLPSRSLSAEQADHLIAFLRALTDRCAANVTCRSAWTPSADLDPDGHLLGVDNGLAPELLLEDVVTPDSYPDSVPLEWPGLPAVSNFSDLSGCSAGAVANSGASRFERRDSQLGLTAAHGFSVATWSYDERLINIETTMEAGGVSSVYLNDDCWPDVIMTGGDTSGLVAYINLGNGNGYLRNAGILGGDAAAEGYRRLTGVAVADLDGDYRRELVLGNLHNGYVQVLSPDAAGVFRSVAGLPMTRSTFGISLADYDADGYLDMMMGHWDADGVDGTAPAFWKGTGNALLNWDNEVKADTSYLNQKWSFTPAFADFRNVRRMDFALTVDFGTSTIMQNNQVSAGVFEFQNVTDRSVITDQNGMGSALGDIDNDGSVDWFVTAIKDPNGVAEANWGVSGNRLYRNISTPLSLAFEDITEQAGVRDGGWGWGACMADFNNDGFLDIFHVNGFGLIPEAVRSGFLAEFSETYAALAGEFIGVAPRLFINQGGGVFVDKTAEWGLDVPSEGRGLTCFDHDRDGDIDIALLDHSTGMQFFENQSGSGAQRGFLNIRVVGKAPNTDAIGTRVYVTANVGGSFGLQRQMRISQANSHFNSQDVPDLHFGLGEASSIASLRIEWPDNTGMICTNVSANQFLVFDQRDLIWPKLDFTAPLCAWYPNIAQIAFDAL